MKLNKNIIFYGTRFYALDKFSSCSRIIMRDTDNSKVGKRVFVWEKDFSFSGDKLIIKKEFEIPLTVSIPKEKRLFLFDTFKANPVYKFVMYEIPTFEEFKENIYKGEAKWYDYAKYVAEKTNSLNEFNYVYQESTILVNMLNKKFNSDMEV